MQKTGDKGIDGNTATSPTQYQIIIKNSADLKAGPSKAIMDKSKFYNSKIQEMNRVYMDDKVQLMNKSKAPCPAVGRGRCKVQKKPAEPGRFATFV